MEEHLLHLLLRGTPANNWLQAIPIRNRDSSGLSGSRSQGESFRFMKHHILSIMVMVVVSMFSGCSRHSPYAKAPIDVKTTTDTTALKVTDLGVVDVSGDKPIRRDLGDGRACVITPTVITKGGARFIRMRMVVEQTDSSSLVHRQAAPIIICNPGDIPEWRVGDIEIRLKTEVKP